MKEVESHYASLKEEQIKPDYSALFSPSQSVQSDFEPMKLMNPLVIQNFHKDIAGYFVVHAFLIEPMRTHFL